MCALYSADSASIADKRSKNCPNLRRQTQEDRYEEKQLMKKPNIDAKNSNF